MNLISRARNSFKYRLGIRDHLREGIDSLLSRIPEDFGGACSAQKAYVMAWLIRRFRLQSTVDIGVYRGRSLFPQALAHQRYTNGKVYGVDPWSRAEAREKDNPELFEQIEAFIDQTDFESIYGDVARMSREFEPHVALVRQPSSEAAALFADQGIRFGLVHIDGNHDRDKALGDVEKYLPLLLPNGFIVMDDILWESVRPAYELCAARLSLVYERTDIGYSVFCNRESTASLKRKLAELPAW